MSMLSFVSYVFLPADIPSVFLLLPFGMNYPLLSGSPNPLNTFKRGLKAELTSAIIIINTFAETTKSCKHRHWWHGTLTITTTTRLLVVVVVIAQQLFFYRQLSRLRKSATAAGLSHRSCTVSCVGWLWQLNRISTECVATPHSSQTPGMPLVMRAL